MHVSKYASNLVVVENIEHVFMILFIYLFLLCNSASWGFPIRGWAVTYQLYAKCTISIIESVNCRWTSKAFRCWCQSCSCLLHQWNNKNHCTRCSLWWWTNEGMHNFLWLKIQWTWLLSCSLQMTSVKFYWWHFLSGGLSINCIFIWKSVW